MMMIDDDDGERDDDDDDDDDGVFEFLLRDLFPDSVTYSTLYIATSESSSTRCIIVIGIVIW